MTRLQLLSEKLLHHQELSFVDSIYHNHLIINDNTRPVHPAAGESTVG